ncbi:MAG: ATP-binding protein [Candidatus Saccharimonadales bacterium]
MPKTEITAAASLSAYEQQAETEALFTSIGDGAIATDEFGRITRVNPTAEYLLGYRAKELVGGWFPKKLVAVDGEDMPVNLIDRPITKAFLTGKPVSDKVYYRRKDGQRLPVSLTVSPILLGGKPLGAIEVFRDITLEQEVDRMKSEFISLASHQLRTPLSAIKTYTHMLYDGFMGELNDAQKKSLSTIIGASDRMNELISTLLNITRMESGTIAVTMKSVRAQTVAEDVIKELTLMAGTKSIALDLRVTPKSGITLVTDALILKEIMTNLVSNAIKYTPDKGRVSIRLRKRTGSMLVEIADSGWGIPKFSQDQIFSKFFRAHNIVKRETTGTGLGLYLVKGLVDALGGRIWFTSKEGKGTSFFFSLPLKPPKTPNKPRQK